MSTVKELKAALSVRGLGTLGRKAVLQERLLSHLLASDEMSTGTASASITKRARTDNTDADERTSDDSEAGSALHAKLQCPICFEMIFPPIHQCTSGHLICGECKSKLQAQGICPQCRSVLSGRCLALEQVASDVRMPCLNADVGCDALATYTNMMDHANSCDYRSAQCPLSSGCEFRGTWKELLEHVMKSDTRCNKSVGHDHIKQISPISKVLQFWEKQEGKSVFRSRIWKRVYILPGGDVGILRVVESKKNPAPCAAFYFYFIGPDSERSKYSCVISMKSGRRQIKHSLELLSLHAEQPIRPFDDSPLLKDSVLTISADEAKHYQLEDELSVEYKFRVNKWPQVGIIL